MNPQLENGYTMIANEILEALCRFRIPGEQMQCLLVIIRKTYGYGKKEDAISNSQFVKETGLKKGNVSRAIAELSKKQLVIKKDNGKIPTYRFNKNYSKWEVLSKLQPVINITTSVIKTDNKVLSKVMDTKERKKLLQKKDIIVADVKEIFLHWNGKGIIFHKSQKDFEEHIKARLKNGYTKDDIISAIDNYAFCLESDDHFWTHKWGLKDFLIRKGAIDKFLPINNPRENYKKDKNQIAEIPIIGISEQTMAEEKKRLEALRAQTPTQR